MSQSETRAFLENLLLRFDPDLDIGEGSRARVELIDPIVTRVGPDPFDDDIQTFILSRIQQTFPNLAITEEDALRDVLIDPMRVLLEPLVREVRLIKLRSSLRNLESLGDDEVDALLGNFFEARVAGGYALGVVRCYFSSPQTVSFSVVNAATTRTGLRFFPTRPQQITADQMLLNVEGSEYYVDVNYRGEGRGEEYNVEPDQIISIANLPSAARITNRRRFGGGTPRETNTEFAARVQSSVSDKTLTVERGIRRTLKEAYPGLRRLFVVGFRDPEMKRDVVRGGSLGPIPADDTFGSFYGQGTPHDDLDGDFTTPFLDDPSGFFVSRLGSAGSDPGRWYMTLVYTSVGLVVVDARVVRVIGSTRVELDHEIPVSVGSVTWALRERRLSITDVPGGITLPDTAEGTLELRADEVHIGGKTDVYVAGAAEQASARISILTDEKPVARGGNAETTGGSNVVTLYDASLTAAEVQPGWSVVLEEGGDAGGYRILRASGSPLQLTVDQDMVGTLSNLSWRIVDDISVELMDPKNIKLTGSDLITAAGSTTVTTASSANFIDANVRAGDVLRLEGEESLAGDYVVTEVNAVTLRVDPAPPRTAGEVRYTLFTRSEALLAPVIRIRNIELLDSSGAPVGTSIPYRDPVLTVSRAFQNEGATLSFAGNVILGLVTRGESGSFVLGGLTLEWSTYDPDRIWAGPLTSGTLTFGGALTPTQVVAAINANSPLDAAGVKAVALTYAGQSFVGLYSLSAVRVDGGTALTELGLVVGMSNGGLRPLEVGERLVRVQLGDVLEVIDGPNSGRTSRVHAHEVDPTLGSLVTAGVGPLGPTPGTALYNRTLFNPDVGPRVRLGRPSVGSARAYFLDPTSAEFDYRETSFTAEGATRTLTYRPDPENLRVLRPAPPLQELPRAGVTRDVSGRFEDLEADFLFLNVRAGDLLEVLYQPITGTVVLPPATDVAVGGLTLSVRLDSDPFIAVAFPYNMPRQDVVSYINERTGTEIASIAAGGQLRLQPKFQRLEVGDGSTALTVLGLTAAPRNNDHPAQGTYILSEVLTATELVLSGATPLPALGFDVADTQYRIARYVQRISSTEMNTQRDATQLYYADVELQSVAPGNEFNLGADVKLEVAGHRSDGYRLSGSNPVLSYSRAEELQAEISRSMLLVGSSDSPDEYVQLSQQNILINYDRSALVDEIQSFVDSRFERVVCAEILVRHLLPHYVSLNWAYAGGGTEPEVQRALRNALDEVEPDEQLEVNDLTDVLRRRGATSVYTPDPESPTGRRAPIAVVIYHDEERRVRGTLVKDFVSEKRAHRFIGDALNVRRTSPGGLR